MCSFTKISKVVKISIQIPPKKTNMRLLLLDGDDGTVICRIHDPQCCATLPRLSPNGRIECASRSILRLKNLIAVRGSRGHSMIGPIDYFGNLEKPHEHSYTVCVSDPKMPFLSHSDDSDNISLADNQQKIRLTPLTPNQISWVPCKWESHSTSGASHDSLFPNTGVLHMTEDVINLVSVSTLSDLSAFKARLLSNYTPFRITSQVLPASDEFRLISYVYEPGYRNYQVNHGSGLFLERHEFAQTITPAKRDCGGFVTLALSKSQNGQNGLSMIAVQIPYGRTLIVEPGCIHGDATLVGTFIMGMTSNHVTMQKADTVFLRHKGCNVNFKVESLDDVVSNLIRHNAIVTYKDDDEKQMEDVKDMVLDHSMIFNPLSKAFWPLSSSKLS